MAEGLFNLVLDILGGIAGCSLEGSATIIRSGGEISVRGSVCDRATCHSCIGVERLG